MLELALRLSRGKFEWKGDWSDMSDLWNKYPNVKLEMGLISGLNKYYGVPLSLKLSYYIRYQSIGRSAADDGVFFMSWSDFQRHFDSIDVLMLSRSLDDFQLDQMEDFGACGPTVGCCLGQY
jgi:hypothetical protein